ncbi:MAG: hypothetical protein KF708_11045 [Pirellulales bacterium]|nr:hypothetical protein [Pirellulales bacterium]
MSSRERWTIYPLLFFSIGLAMYDRVVSATIVDTDVVQCDVVECRRLRVLGASGQEQASLSERGLVAHSARITALGGEDRLILDTGNTSAGQFQLLGADGNRRVALGSDDNNHVGEIAVFGVQPELPLTLISAENGGGMISTQNAAGQRLMFFTHNNGAGTMVSFDAEGKPHFYLTATLRQPPPGSGEAETPETQSPPPAEEQAPAEDEPASAAPVESDTPAETDSN